MNTANENGPVAANEGDRVRQILAEGFALMNAEKIHPLFIFLALVELVAMFAALNGEEQACALATKDIETYVEKWRRAYEKQKRNRN